MISIENIKRVKEESGRAIVENIVILDKNNYKEGTTLGMDNKEDWYTYSHYRFNNKFYQIGFRLNGVSKKDDYKLYLGAYKESDLYELSYNKEKDIYYETPGLIQRKGKLTFSKETQDVVAGMDSSGVFYLYIKNKSQKIVYISPPIHVLPSSMSYKDYKDMLEDLLNIKDQLVINNKSKLGFQGNWQYRLDKLIRDIDKLKKILNRIDSNPKSTFSKE